MSLLQHAAAIPVGDTGYDIDNSLKFETDNTEYLMAEGRPQGTQTKWTWSCWLKRTEVNNGAIAQYIFSAGSDGKLGLYFRDDASSNGGDTIFIYVDEGNSLKWIGELRVSFRDTSAWYHIVFAVDSTDGTPADRTKIYVNGVQQTITFNSTLNQNVSTRVGDGGGKFAIGGKVANTAYGFNGYMAECVLVDGSALTPTSFGEYDDDSGIWKPKDVSGLSLGTTGFYMNFDDSSNVGAVQSGTSQGNFDKYNLDSSDQAVDSPTNNFAILSQSMQGYYEDLWSVISDGGTKFRCTEFDSWITTVSSIGVTKGKWYAEFQPTGARPNNMYGIASMEQLDNNSGYIYGGHLGEANESWGIGYYQPNGNLYKQQNSGYTLTSSFGSSISQNQKVGVAIDMDNHNLYIAINNTWQNSGDPTSGATGTGAISFDATETVAFGLSGYSLGSGNDTIVSVNFGGYRTGGLPSINSTDANGYGVFRYAPPSGYYALCTKNLAEYG